jgi:hypothetical protein
MRLYHYTGRDHVEGIRELGIVAAPHAFLGLGITGAPAVWLTTSDDWSAQRRSWATSDELECDRSERRFVLDLSVAETALWRWHDFGPRLCAMAGATLDDLRRFDAVGGSGDWWVYLRSIAPQRVGELERRP